MQSYLGITCHYIADFQLKSVMLACQWFLGSHTGECIAALFEEIVESFEITGKVLFVVTDNPSNMLRAFELLTVVEESVVNVEDDSEDEELTPEEFESELPVTDQPCFAHTVQLVIKDGLKEAAQVNKVLGKVSKLVTHIRSSTKASDLIGAEVRLQAANATRWNSQLYMLKSLLKVSNDTLEQIYFNGKSTQHDIVPVKDIMEILSPFEWATNLIQGQNRVTSSMILPIVRGLHKEVGKLHQKFKSRFVVTLKSSIETRLTKYETQECFQLAAALDPRWKLVWCTTAQESTQVKKKVIQKVKVNVMVQLHVNR